MAGLGAPTEFGCGSQAGVGQLGSTCQQPHKADEIATPQKRPAWASAPNRFPIGTLALGEVPFSALRCSPF